MPQSLHITDITRVIQLAVAPVFLLTALGTILAVLSGRLARIVDRARVILDRIQNGPAEDRERLRDELGILVRRRRLVNMAITCGVSAALLVCLVIAAAFIGYIIRVDFAVLIALLFIGAMVGFMGALVLFLRETLVAVRNLGFRVE